jgi:hypothetical protein
MISRWRRDVRPQLVQLRKQELHYRPTIRGRRQISIHGVLDRFELLVGDVEDLIVRLVEQKNFHAR